MNVSVIGSTGAPQAYTGGERAAAHSGNGGSNAVAAPVLSEGGMAVMSDAELEKIMEEPIKQANNALKGYDRQIEREIHEVTKALMYTIRDTNTNEVIAEYPPKKIQDMIAKMWELAGLFIDQKA